MGRESGHSCSQGVGGGWAHLKGQFQTPVVLAALFLVDGWARIFVFSLAGGQRPCQAASLTWDGTHNMAACFFKASEHLSARQM